MEDRDRAGFDSLAENPGQRRVLCRLFGGCGVVERVERAMAGPRGALGVWGERWYGWRDGGTVGGTVVAESESTAETSYSERRSSSLTIDYVS